MAIDKVTQLHEFYMCCGECDGDTWYIKMSPDLDFIEGISCANPECDNFVEDTGLTIEVELD